MTELSTYYNTYDPKDRYWEVMIRAGYAVQSREFNEMQFIVAHRAKGIADALFRDGDVVRSARVVVDKGTGMVTCESGAVYLHGAVRDIDKKEFAIPMVGMVTIGLYLQETILTELEVPALRDPAVGTGNFDQPGAARRRVEAVWGYAGDGKSGKFYPVYEIEDGTLRAKEPPPTLNTVTDALARYDRDSAGGSYVVSGLTVAKAADLEFGKQVYTVSEGRARVDGYPVTLVTSYRFVHTTSPDLRYIDSEPHVSTTADAQRVDFDRPPVGNIVQVRITEEKTVTLTHGPYGGAQDILPDTSVLLLVSVVQGGTTYAVDADYKLTAGKVDWSPDGAEPATGSTYEVTYRYIATVTPTDADATGFTVTGAVAGTLVQVNYNQMLPRIDRIALASDGKIVAISGVSTDQNPQPPPTTGNLLPLADIQQTWTSDRRVIGNGVRVVPMSVLDSIDDRIDHLAQLVAGQRLMGNARLREAGIIKGMFTDPFLSDDMRDAGIPQTAAIVGGELMLPISATAKTVPDDVAVGASLAFDLVAVLSQESRTESMQVNPYRAFDPLPARVVLTPPFDRWTVTDTQWASARTQRFVAGSGLSQANTSTLISSSRRDAETLRPIDIDFTLEGFGPNETLESLEFDGIAVTPTNMAGEQVTLTADANGALAGRFTIPADVPVGAKRVAFRGAGGNRGDAVFVGHGELVTELRQRITRATTTLWRAGVDPLAQTFIMEKSVQLGAVDLWFTAKGSSNVGVQVRETSLGFPTEVVLAETWVSPVDIETTGETRVRFDAPISLMANTRYALVVLCDDADTALSVAKIGKWDAAASRLVASQPYQVGVLLSSSDAFTWSAHQEMDLSFRFLSARYTETERTLPMGEVAVQDATDLMLFSVTENPSASARVEHRLTLPDASIVIVSDGQPVRLAAPITGNVAILTRLSGTAEASPVLFPGTQLVHGKVSEIADYVSRAVPAGTGSRVRVIFDALIPSGSTITVEVSGTGDGDPWVPVPYLSSTPVGHGWMEMIHELDPVDEDSIRVRLSLGGNTAARPRVRDLRVMVM
uniref:DUF4815 domain-containing protein n=1 Tax=Candidatus Kentrum sp. LFY TaxID=2126342 RepID=A0A450WH37_9GAMM|nr:MAG: protein of unknown function (DUF4815) [Candidatus Kentron sp. LFY]